MRQITNAEELQEFLNEQQQPKPPTATDTARADYYKAKADYYKAKAEASRKQQPTNRHDPQPSATLVATIITALTIIFELIFFAIIFN